MHQTIHALHVRVVQRTLGERVARETSGDQLAVVKAGSLGHGIGSEPNPRHNSSRKGWVSSVVARRKAQDASRNSGDRRQSKRRLVETQTGRNAGRLVCFSTIVYGLPFV